MLEQVGQAVKYYFFYTKNGAGVAGLTVTVDVYAADDTLLVNDAEVTEIGGGLYCYTLAGVSVDAAGGYPAIAHTAGDVDAADQPSLWIAGAAWVENVNDAVSDAVANAAAALAAALASGASAGAALLYLQRLLTALAEAGTTGNASLAEAVGEIGEAALPEISFADTDPAAILSNMIALAEAVLGRTLAPADPVRLLLDTLAAVLAQERYILDYAARMNLLDYSQPPYLNALGAFFETTQLPAAAALTTLRVTLSAAQPGVVTIPAGTRASAGDVVFATLANADIAIGETVIDIDAAAVVAGTAGNGFLPGQISRMVDVLPNVQSISNTTVSQSGSDLEDTEAYRARIREAIHSFSTAGPAGAYRYWARSASASIIDVAVLSPLDLGAPTVLFGVVPPEDDVTGEDGQYYIDTAGALLYGPRVNGAWGTGYDIIGARGQVLIYPLLEGGELPGSELLALVEAECDPDNRRPLTDQVIALAPSAVEYDRDVTYYIDRAQAASATDIQAAVEQAALDYDAWQTGAIGRDINPSELIYRMMAAGAKRVVVTAPAFTALAPNEVAQLDAASVTYGGLEDA